MKKLLVVLLAMSVSAMAQVADYSVKKSTGVVKHSEYQSFFETGYSNFRGVLSETLSDFNCTSKVGFQSLREDSLFRKGEFIGSVEISCFNKNMKEVNVFFQVFPRDEENVSVIEVVLNNGKKERIVNCWDMQGKDFECEAQNKIEFNFN